MENIVYSKEKMNLVRNKIQTMIGIVAELEKEFPGRHFTLDGHLVGSIGEVMAVLGSAILKGINSDVAIMCSLFCL